MFLTLFKPLHRVYLKVKIKSLAAESQIIRFEEKRHYAEAQRNGLHAHRVVDVRMESRAAQLAYAYLRGKPITSCEVKHTNRFDRLTAMNRAKQLVRKFGTKEAYEAFGAWSSNGTAPGLQSGDTAGSIPVTPSKNCA